MLSGESFWNFCLYEVEIICCSWIQYWKPSGQYLPSQPPKIPAFFRVAPSQLLFISCKLLQKLFSEWTFRWILSCLFPLAMSPGGFFFFCLVLSFFLSGLSQILAPLAPLFLKCPVVHKKCRAEKNSGQGDKRGLCHKIFVLVHKAQRFEPQRLPDCFKILFIFLFLWI